MAAFFRQNVCVKLGACAVGAMNNFSSTSSRADIQNVSCSSPKLNSCETSCSCDECAENASRGGIASSSSQQLTLSPAATAAAELFKFSNSSRRRRRKKFRYINFILKFQQKKIALLSFLSRFHKFPELASSFGILFSVPPSSLLLPSTGRKKQEKNLEERRAR
jgi:hypothetical protein